MILDSEIFLNYFWRGCFNDSLLFKYLHLWKIISTFALPNLRNSRYMEICSQDIDLFFETSWEVCNKIGGIYTVLSTKAKTLKEQFGDKLIFIGPDVWTEEHPSPSFIPVRNPLSRWVKEAMLPEGVEVRAGRWDVPGRPLAVLVKFDGMYATKDEAYGKMWELYNVDSLHAYGDYDEGCAFARSAAVVIESLINWLNVNPDKVVALFDEWTTAMGLLQLKAEMPEVATIFTTHATSIGRSICGNGKPLYDYLRNYSGDQMAAELNMQSKHSLEKAAAWNADCFTTVSDVTATEAEQLLGIRPEVTPNGFELNFVPAKNRYNAARNKARNRMLEVGKALTGIDFNDDTFIVATSGRCEFRNKGLDVYLDALKKLEQSGCSRRVLAFVMVPAWSAGPRVDLKHAIEQGCTGRLSDPVITHNLHNYREDPVNRYIHSLSFANDANSNVCVIYVPCYLDGDDGIFNLTYYQLLPGLDATVFASYYEPWGYTPMESVAFGVPTLTTTLAGFGMWVEANCVKGLENCGVSVLKRTDSNYAEVVENISANLKHIMDCDNQTVGKIRNAAMNTASKAQWSDFIKFYDAACCKALEQRDVRNLK